VRLTKALNEVPKAFGKGDLKQYINAYIKETAVNGYAVSGNIVAWYQTQGLPDPYSLAGLVQFKKINKQINICWFYCCLFYGLLKLSHNQVR